jgi:hypothetical protein
MAMETVKAMTSVRMMVLFPFLATSSQMIAPVREHRQRDFCPRRLAGLASPR